MVGILIRQLRMERGYSQEGLARGICAVSYLSKIEQGQAEPGADILDRLFAALGVEYCRDEKLLAEGRVQLADYYEARERDAAAEQAVSWLEAHWETLRYSDLCLSLQIWRLYRAMDEQNREAAARLSAELCSQQGRMDPEQQFRFLTVQAEVIQEPEEALDLLRQAARTHSCAMAHYRIAGLLYHLGRYSACIEVADRAYHQAAEEGELYVLIWSSFLLGSCYAAIDMAFAEKYYRRSIRLGKTVEPRLEPWVAYNLGASYLEWGQPEKALYWLSRAKTVENNYKHNLLLAQKKALLFVLLGRREDAARAYEAACRVLEEAQPSMDAWERQVYADMVRFAELQLAGLRDREYELLLRRIYDQAGEQLGFGFRKFYGRYLVELYRSQRRYKDAMAVMEETQTGLS